MWILVVEDENSMREALRQGLEEENHTVTLAARRPGRNPRGGDAAISTPFFWM